MIIFLSPYFACNVYIYTYTHTHIYVCVCRALPGGSVVKNPPANAGDVGSIPGSGRSSRGNGNPLQYSCLENPRDGSLVGCCLWGRTESDMTDMT